jgi:hypothetical protein
MTDIAAKYKIPDEVMAFVNSGLLVLLAEDEAEKTVEFHIPSKRWTDDAGRTTTYSLNWTHPDFNAEFCRYYERTPGDLPNFEVEIDTDDVGSDSVDGLESVDDLVMLPDWLAGDGLRAVGQR